MKEKDPASPKENYKKPIFVLIISLLLLIGVVFWISSKSTSPDSFGETEKAAVTMWLWKGNTASSSGLASRFKRATDLAVEIEAIGFINENGNFVESNTTPQNSRGAVKLAFTNKGKGGTENWYFEAKLPTAKSFTYTSEMFAPLKKREVRTFTLSYDQDSYSKDKTFQATIIGGDYERKTKNNTDERVVSN